MTKFNTTSIFGMALMMAGLCAATPAAAASWPEEFRDACGSLIPDLVNAAAGTEAEGTDTLHNSLNPREPDKGIDIPYRITFETNDMNFAKSRMDDADEVTARNSKVNYFADRLDICRLELGLRRRNAGASDTAAPKSAPPAQTARNSGAAAGGNAAPASNPNGRRNSNRSGNNSRTGAATSSGNSQLALNQPQSGRGSANTPGNASGPDAPTANAQVPAPVSECVALNPKPSLYVGFINKCAFKVNVGYCAMHPKKGAWNELFDCQQAKGGLDSIEANGVTAAHTNGTFMFWLACKAPYLPDAVSFGVNYESMGGRCR